MVKPALELTDGDKSATAAANDTDLTEDMLIEAAANTQRGSRVDRAQSYSLTVRFAHNLLPA